MGVRTPPKLAVRLITAGLPAATAPDDSGGETPLM